MGGWKEGRAGREVWGRLWKACKCMRMMQKVGGRWGTVGEAAESMQMQAHDAEGREGGGEVWGRLRKADSCLRMMQKGGRG